MSLSDFAKFAASLIDAMFDKPTFDIRGELLAPPLTKNYGTVGTAFDYAMRLKLLSFNRKFVKDFPLVARHGAKADRKRKQFLSAFDQRKDAYLRGEMPIVSLLPDCVALAKLEAVFRSGRNFPNADIFYADEEDIRDLRRLVELVEEELFTATQQCILNPTFGQSSLDVGGADADFIIDGTLVEIKTTKTIEFKREYFRQLMGYYILNKREHDMHGEIEKLGIYFSRFGELLTFPTPMLHQILVEGDAGKEKGAWEAVEAAIRAYNEPD